MIVDHDKKFVFIAIAKTGTTSIHRRVVPEADDPPPHIYHMFLKNILMEHDVEDYYKCAFVRNPYDRVVSVFHDLRFAMGHYWAKPAISQFNTFKEFVMGYEHTPCMDFIHLRPQTEYLEVDNKIDVDFIGHFETLADDFYQLEERLNIPHAPLEHHRPSSHPPFEELYDEESKDIIKRIYHDDFENFGYQR